jgi:hypothetical protein
VNALATPDNTNCPCCLIEQGVTPTNTGEPRVCARHYARENAVWQAYREGREAWDALQSTQAFLERFQNGLEAF